MTIKYWHPNNQEINGISGVGTEEFFYIFIIVSWQLNLIQTLAEAI